MPMFTGTAREIAHFLRNSQVIADFIMAPDENGENNIAELTSIDGSRVIVLSTEYDEEGPHVEHVTYTTFDIADTEFLDPFLDQQGGFIFNGLDNALENMRHHLVP